MEDFAFEIKCRKYLIKRLETLAADITKTVDKEKAVRKAKVEKLSEYKTVDEAHEAYGWDIITEDEFNEIRESLESGKNFVEFTKTPKSVSFDILMDFIVGLYREVRSFEWDMKTPGEQEKIKKARNDFRIENGLDPLN